MYDSILVATDGSQDAGAAAAHAAGLAAGLDATLHAVAVIDTRTGYDSAIVDPEQVEARLRERAQEALSEVESIADEYDVSVVTKIPAGAPHEEILDYVDDHDVDLVVVGARGRSSFRAALLGSTVDALVRLAPGAVLVVDEDGAVETRT